MTNPPQTLFHKYHAGLESQRSTLIAAVIHDLRDQIESYRRLPVERVTEIVESALRSIMKSLLDHSPQPMEHWAQRNLVAGIDLGIHLQEALRFLAIFRHQIIHLSLDTLIVQTPGAAEAVLFLTKAFDRITETVGSFYQSLLEESAKELDRFRLVAENSIDGVIISNLRGKVYYVNSSIVDMYRVDDAGALIGQPSTVFFAPEEFEFYNGTVKPHLIQHGKWQGKVWGARFDGSRFLVHVSSFLLRDQRSRPIGLAALLRDVTAEHQAAEERMRLQDEIIRMQAATLAELSTPLIPISDQVVVMPLIGSVDAARAQQVLETLLHGISLTRAQCAILDITGVAVVDTQVANALLGAAQAARLVGAEVIITGIRPEVAQTLVGLGVNLEMLITRGTLQSGIAYALERRKGRSGNGARWG